MEIVNFVITIISIFVTGGSIILSYKAMTSAKEAALNSKKALDLADNFDVFAFVRQFDNVVKDLMVKTLSPTWTKGKSEEEIVNISAPLLYMMMDFNQISPKLNLNKADSEKLLKYVENVRSALKKLSNVQDNSFFLSMIEKNCSFISKMLNNYLQNIKANAVSKG